MVHEANTGRNRPRRALVRLHRPRIGPSVHPVQQHVHGKVFTTRRRPGLLDRARDSGTRRIWTSGEEIFFGSLLDRHARRRGVVFVDRGALNSAAGASPCSARFASDRPRQLHDRRIDVAPQVRLSLHPAFALTSAGLVLITLAGASALLSFAGVAALTATLIIWLRHSHRTRK
jgi:hypothetical protein